MHLRENTDRAMSTESTASVTDLARATEKKSATVGGGFLGGLLGRETAAKIARRLPLFMFKKFPTMIVIDVTNLCNLRCPVCPVTFAMNRTRGLMGLDTFKAMIDDVNAAGRKPAIYFNFSGEPTLNKALPEMIAYAAERGHDTFVSTNATKLSPEMSRRLVKSGLRRINLCMDGFSKESQESYRINSNFDQVKQGIEDFLRIKKEAGSKYPVTVLQTLLTSNSEPEIPAMLEWAKEIGFDRVRLKTFSLGSYTSSDFKKKYEHFLPVDSKLRRHADDSISTVCTVPMYQTVVFWNGQLGLCCIDYDQMVKLPNVLEQGFTKAYMSDEAARARRDGYAKRFDICQNCNYSTADNMGFTIDLKPKQAA
jgi:MoaA/NifB/PqqE/SkfB family radical SAM enzyme